MKKQEFLDFTRENFNVEISFMRLLENVLTYAERLEESEQYNFLDEVLSGTIGYTNEEIKSINL
jgi:hypothetical protein